LSDFQNTTHRAANLLAQINVTQSRQGERASKREREPERLCLLSHMAERFIQREPVHIRHNNHCGRNGIIYLFVYALRLFALFTAAEYIHFNLAGGEMPLMLCFPPLWKCKCQRMVECARQFQHFERGTVCIKVNSLASRQNN
jgi:hypothetical protein